MRLCTSVFFLYTFFSLVKQTSQGFKVANPANVSTHPKSKKCWHFDYNMTPLPSKSKQVIVSTTRVENMTSYFCSVRKSRHHFECTSGFFLYLSRILCVSTQCYLLFAATISYIANNQAGRLVQPHLQIK